MLRADFFYKFFKYKNNSSLEIIKHSSNENFDLKDRIQNKIIEIDREISENSKSLLEAEIVKLRSNFSSSNNFIDRMGKNIYKTKLYESINWHQKQIKELYSQRRELQMNLEKIQGIFWLNRIKRFLMIILIGFLALLSLFIFLSGFMIIIYLLPVIILVLFLYLISTKKQ